MFVDFMVGFHRFRGKTEHPRWLFVDFLKRNGIAEVDV